MKSVSLEIICGDGFVISGSRFLVRWWVVQVAVSTAVDG